MRTRRVSVKVSPLLVAVALGLLGPTVLEADAAPESREAAPAPREAAPRR